MTTLAGPNPAMPGPASIALPAGPGCFFDVAEVARLQFPSPGIGILANSATKTSGVAAYERGSGLFEFFDLGLSGGHFRFELAHFFGVVHLLLRAGESRLQLADFLAQQFDAFLGFFVHGGFRRWSLVDWS